MSFSHETPPLLRNRNVHYRDQKALTLNPIVIRMHPLHTLPPYFPKIHSNITFPSTSRSSDLSLPFSFPNQNTHVMSPTLTTRPTHLILIDLITLITTFGEAYKLLILLWNDLKKISLLHRVFSPLCLYIAAAYRVTQFISLACVTLFDQQCKIPNHTVEAVHFEAMTRM
jgi:hypothetical protein